MSDTNRPEPAPAAPSVLVVDDVPANLDLLCAVLRRRGYRVRPVTSGDLALQAVLADPPDLVLLDISMPEMDGYEVARRLKSDASSREIPIIFLTALTDLSEKVRAFSMGGVDYVTKPFQAEEIEARVTTQIELARQRRELTESHTRLSQLESMRDSLVHMIAHDLRSPLSTVQMSLEYMSLHSDGLPPAFLDDLELSLDATRKMAAMLTAMLDVSKLEGAEMTLDLAPCDLVQITDDVIADFHRLIGDRQVVIESTAGSASLVADATLLARVVQNLFGNAMRFGPPGEPIRVIIEGETDFVRFAVTDRGPGVPEEFRGRIFSKFGAVGTNRGRRGDSTGLGLPFCRLAVEAHRGSIGVTDGPDGVGSTFWFTVPRQQT